MGTNLAVGTWEGYSKIKMEYDPIDMIPTNVPKRYENRLPMFRGASMRQCTNAHETLVECLDRSEFRLESCADEVASFEECVQNVKAQMNRIDSRRYHLQTITRQAL